MNHYTKISSISIFSAFFALGFLSVSPPSLAYPGHITRPEILLADINANIDSEQLSIVVLMPPSCRNAEEIAVCKELAEFVPSTPYKFTYSIANNIEKVASITEQIKIIPTGLKTRRYLMVLDWALRIKEYKGNEYAYINSEAVVYDQSANKTIWHAIALNGSQLDAKHFQGIAASHISQHAYGDFNNYGKIEVP